MELGAKSIVTSKRENKEQGSVDTNHRKVSLELLLGRNFKADFLQ